MSLVAYDTATLDNTDQELVATLTGGVYMVYVDGTDLDTQDLTVTVQTAVLEGGSVVAHTVGVLSGPTPADPAVLAVGPVYSLEPISVSAVLSTATTSDCPWRVEQEGRCASVEDGQGTITATGSEQTLVTVPYGGLFALLVDVSNMASGDDLKLRLKARGGDPTSAIVTTIYRLLEDGQTNKIAQVGPLRARDTVVATLHQTAGTNRAFNWALVRLA